MKRRRVFVVVLFVSALSALPFARAQLADGAEAALRHTIVALSGDAAPAGGTFLPFSFFNATLNARHQIAFDAAVGGPPVTTGVFVGNGTETSAIAFGINPDPDAPSFGFVSNPFILPNGDIVFDVNDGDIFMTRGKRVVPLVRGGDNAPGGGTLTPFGERAANDLGAVAYIAGLTGSSATRGIFRTDPRGTIAIARDDALPPTGGAFTLLSTPVLNDRGQVAFFAVMTGGAADFGIFRGEGAELTPVFVANQIAPGAGGTAFVDFGSPAINNHGQVAVFASLASATTRQGLFLGDGATAVAIALEGQSAPAGGAYGDRFGRDAFQGPVRLNDRGELVFGARLTGGTSVAGLFHGNGVRTTTIALAGTTAPGTTGTFLSFDDFKIGIDGRVAFTATLAPGVGGVDVSNNRGIWVGTPDGDLHLVVRTGDVIDGKVLTRLPPSGLNNQFDTNENGVLWVGNFGAAKAVVLSRLPGDDDDAGESGR